MNQIIGRVEEIKLLTKLLQSQEAEFLAVYGRRRVGKTFLIREFFMKKGIYIEATGEKDGNLKTQLENFMKLLQETFRPKLPIEKPTSWKQAFDILTILIESLSTKRKVILFFDELPWMATKRSGLIQALDYFWNRKWSQMPFLKVVVCGSAATWMINNLIHAKGGLYNRLTETIHLKPFTLAETKAYLESRGIKLKEPQILELFMVFGGIPFYLRHIEKGKSPTQNINDLCFHRDAPFFTEFDQLFHSLFDEADTHIKLIRAIAKKRNGISRDELLKATNMTSGGTFNKRMHELETSSFIEIVTPYGKLKKNQYVKIIDEYTLFYLYWIDDIRHRRIIGQNDQYWLSKSKEAKYKIWCGYAFEAVCLKHINQIIATLELTPLVNEIGAWHFNFPQKELDQGTQIDLLLDRSDSTITLCEIKHHQGLFSLDKSYARNLINKMDVFEKQTKTKKQLFICLITLYGVKPNIWSEDLVNSEVTLKNLFENRA